MPKRYSPEFRQRVNLSDAGRNAANPPLEKASSLIWTHG